MLGARKIPREDLSRGILVFVVRRYFPASTNVVNG